MNHDPGTSGNGATHPYAALSAYVDGSATKEEAATVEAHLAYCADCRAETELARAGRDALLGLPALEAPGVIAEVLRRAGADVPRPAEVIELRARERTVRWGRLAVGLGVAAALVLGAVFLPHLLGGGGGGVQGASQPARAPEGGRGGLPAGGAAPVPAVQLRRSATDYTPLSLSALAVRLQSSDFEKGRPAPAFGAPQPEPSPITPSVSGQTSQGLAAQATQALSCAASSAGLPASTQIVYLEAARFQGTPVYVAAFRTEQGGARGYLVVVAATRTDCRAIHIVSRRI